MLSYLSFVEGEDSGSLQILISWRVLMPETFGCHKSPPHLFCVNISETPNQNDKSSLLTMFILIRYAYK
jgi:hypothetical protein